MPIDSAAKRKAAAGIPFIPTPPMPDGNISARDRAALAGVYTASNTSSVKVGIIADVHHTDSADESWGGGVNQGPVQWRKYSTAESRLTAFCNAMNAAGADVCIQLGDFMDNSSTNTNLEEIVQTVTDSDWSGLWYNVAGNHEQYVWGDDFSDYEARINNSAYDDGLEQNSADLSYSFDVNGIHFVVLFLTGFNTTGVPVWATIEPWLVANLAATDLPVVIFSHALIGGSGSLLYEPICASAATIRTVLENAGNVQTVICGHYHWAGFDTVINDIPYRNLRGSVLSDTSEDFHNAYYLFEIIPDAIYTPNGMKANIKLTGYEEGSAQSKELVTYGIGA